MLTLPAALRDAIAHQARTEHPLECCGLIAAVPSEPGSLRLVPMHNAAQAEDFFSFEPLQQLRVWREMNGRGEVPLVLYHSHTASRPYPSDTDVEYAAAFPEVFHLIVSTDPRFDLSMRCFRIEDGRILEQPLAFD
ncbi:proteasome lid subunit RPN8/RPN11 [Pseudomonas sp. SLBN-26]|uniref:Mov34/MPN/PAD-1 family protein n=1 Tax=Pseudomonadaceae TaxID=135621 RepID=UPI00114EF4DA|nr:MULTISPECIES: M67 family metallopeptidase [Pseudomonas]MCP1616619.1 proteasome lid subunit RPN8/RPN11 [Pseudomonas otitidis]TQL05875.1 proteasome lid subunit RPN8/RPN11 [Pseudomonas sp. SLBN-26]